MSRTPDVAPASTDPPARRLGRYELFERIASGGMASVYLGRALGSGGFERVVAIKMCHEHLRDNDDFVKMFLDEARLAAKIHHPNVVPTLDASDVDGLYLVMDFIEGGPLLSVIRAALAQGELVPAPVAIRIIGDTLAGLHAAHELTDGAGSPYDIVHRDVSPPNILVGLDGITRIADFGVAKAAARVSETRDGQLKGKIPYMAPEQFEGQATRQTDVFSAGVVLWETLVGKRLFSGKNDVETMRNVLNLVPAAPSSVAPGVPAALDPIVLRALHKDPAQRFPTAAAFADALEDSGVVPATSRAVTAYLTRVLGAEIETRRGHYRQFMKADVPLMTPAPNSGVTQRKMSEALADQSAPAAATPATPPTANAKTAEKPATSAPRPAPSRPATPSAPAKSTLPTRPARSLPPPPTSANVTTAPSAVSKPTSSQATSEAAVENRAPAPHVSKPFARTASGVTAPKPTHDSSATAKATAPAKAHVVASPTVASPPASPDANAVTSSRLPPQVSAGPPSPAVAQETSVAASPPVVPSPNVTASLPESPQTNVFASPHASAATSATAQSASMPVPPDPSAFAPAPTFGAAFDSQVALAPSPAASAHDGYDSIAQPTVGIGRRGWLMVGAVILALVIASVAIGFRSGSRATPSPSHAVAPPASIPASPAVPAVVAPAEPLPPVAAVVPPPEPTPPPVAPAIAPAPAALHAAAAPTPPRPAAPPPAATVPAATRPAATAATTTAPVAPTRTPPGGQPLRPRPRPGHGYVPDDI